MVPLVFLHRLVSQLQTEPKAVRQRPQFFEKRERKGNRFCITPLMRKLLVTLGVFVAMVSTVIAQDWSFGKPKSANSGISGSSASFSFDDSLFKTVYNFDGLDSGTFGFLYDIAELNGPMHRPLRFSAAGAKGNDGVDLWGGVGVSYDLIKTDRFTFGGSLSSPALNWGGGKLSFATGFGKEWVPGVYVSVKLGD